MIKECCVCPRAKRNFHVHLLSVDRIYCRVLAGINSVNVKDKLKRLFVFFAENHFSRLWHLLS